MLIHPRFSLAQVTLDGVTAILNRCDANELRKKNSSVQIKSLRSKGRSHADTKPSPVRIMSAKEYMASMHA